MPGPTLHCEYRCGTARTGQPGGLEKIWRVENRFCRCIVRSGVLPCLVQRNVGFARTVAALAGNPCHQARRVILIAERVWGACLYERGVAFHTPRDDGAGKNHGAVS